MTLLDLLIGFVGASATVLVVIGMVLIAPLGSVLVGAHRRVPRPPN